MVPIASLVESAMAHLMFAVEEVFQNLSEMMDWKELTSMGIVKVEEESQKELVL
jgi:hypothetical protein